MSPEVPAAPTSLVAMPGSALAFEFSASTFGWPTLSVVTFSSTIFWSTLKTQKPDWVAQKKFSLLVQFAVKKHAELPDTPLITEFVPPGEARQTIELMAMSHLPGRPFVAPPGVPRERLEILRNALMATLRDPLFLADAAKRQMEIEAMTGAEVAAVVESAFRMPRSVVERAKKYMTPEK